MEDNRLPKQLMFGELASGKRKQDRPLKRFKDCVKVSISHAEITPKELQPRAHDRTGWQDLTRHAIDTFEERRRTQIEKARERRKASADDLRQPRPLPMPALSPDLHIYNRTPQRPPCPWQTGETLKSVIIDFDGLLLHLYAKCTIICFINPFSCHRQAQSLTTVFLLLCLNCVFSINL